MLNLGIVIGAQKCGTTALHRAFRPHPQVAASEPKETFYFSDLNKFARGEDWYRSLFSFGPKHKIGLDSSTHYAMYPSYTGVPRRMKETGWNFRFVYVVRNPIERIQSFYQHLAIPDIIDRLLDEWSVERTWEVDRGRYPKLEYKVQYGETDFAFVSRLLSV